MGSNAAWSDPLLELLFDDSAVGRCLAGPDGSILRVNGEWLRAAGVAGLLGPPPDGARRLAEALCARGHPERHVAVPAHARPLEGRETWWEGGVDPVPTPGGRGWLLTLREVRGAGEEPAPGLSGARLRAALESMTDAVFISDLQGNFVEFNEAFATFHRFASKEACARTFAAYPDVLDVFFPDGRVAPVEQWAVPRALRGETVIDAEYRLRRKDTGETWTGSYNFAPIRVNGRIVGSVVIGRDVTEQRRAQDALREREERLAVTLRSIGDAVIATDAAARVTLMNPEAERLTGWSAAEALGRPLHEVFEILDEDTGAAAESPADRVLREGAVVGLGNHTSLLARDGTARPIADSGAPIRGTGGDVTGVVVVFRDQTLERAAERDLRQRELRFRAIFEQAAVGVVEVETASGRFLRVNGRFCEMLGYTPEEVQALTWRELTHPDDVGQDLEGVRRMLQTGTPHRREKRYLRKDGSVLWARVNVNRIAMPGEAPTSQVAVVEDITDQHALEERLRQAQKLESVGRLAGGVAHDFNNLLTVILSCASSLQQDLSGGLPAAIEEVNEILGAGNRAADLTRQLLAFARKQLIAPVRLDLGVVVRNSERMLRRLLGEDVDLRVRLAPGLWTIHADPGQVEQVIVNLAVNARDAMPRGGALLIETANASVGPSAAGDGEGPLVGDWVQLRIRDTGLGMSAEVKAHLFEPFFTTKEPGKGTGLGLATVYGIVNRAGGRVRVESEPGQGSTFEISFPRHQGAAEQPSKPSSRREEGGSERILVVEDEPQVRNVLVRALQGAGYDVVPAAHPLAALELSPDELRQVKLLVTDVVMPGLDGKELASELCRRLPELRVLYLSGYTQDAIAEHGVLETGTQLLPKPFTGTQLLSRVRDILDE
jgi:two-component system cell cycle sensor histidine kinase/response regulator CckA